jgi:hypothetical protein
MFSCSSTVVSLACCYLVRACLDSKRFRCVCGSLALCLRKLHTEETVDAGDDLRGQIDTQGKWGQETTATWLRYAADVRRQTHVMKVERFTAGHLSSYLETVGDMAPLSPCPLACQVFASHHYNPLVGFFFLSPSPSASHPYRLNHGCVDPRHAGEH